MEKSIWFVEATERIHHVLIGMNEKQSKKLKVHVLIRIIERIEKYSQIGCSDCESLKENVDDLIQFLEKNDGSNPKQYKSTFKIIVKHLVKQHGLVEEGAYLAQWISIGLLLGVVFTSLLECALGYGMFVGTMIGSIQDTKARKEGKVI